MTRLRARFCFLPTLVPTRLLLLNCRPIGTDFGMRTSLRPLRHGPCKRPASPAPSLPHHALNHARAHEAAHWLCAFDHRRTSCPAAAAPLRRPAIRPLAGLRLAGGYRVADSTTPARMKPRPGFVSLAIAVPPAPTSCFRLASSRAARRLRRRLRPRLRRLRRGLPCVRAARRSHRRVGVNSPLRVEL